MAAEQPVDIARRYYAMLKNNSINGTARAGILVDAINGLLKESKTEVTELDERGSPALAEAAANADIANARELLNQLKNNSVETYKPASTSVKAINALLEDAASFSHSIESNAFGLISKEKSAIENELPRAAKLKNIYEARKRMSALESLSPSIRGHSSESVIKDIHTFLADSGLDASSLDAGNKNSAKEMDEKIAKAAVKLDDFQVMADAEREAKAFINSVRGNPVWFSQIYTHALTRIGYAEVAKELKVPLKTVEERFNADPKVNIPPVGTYVSPHRIKGKKADWLMKEAVRIYEGPMAEISPQTLAEKETFKQLCEQIGERKFESVQQERNPYLFKNASHKLNGIIKLHEAASKPATFGERVTEQKMHAETVRGK